MERSHCPCPVGCGAATRFSSAALVEALSREGARTRVVPRRILVLSSLAFSQEREGFLLSRACMRPIRGFQEVFAG